MSNRKAHRRDRSFRRHEHDHVARAILKRLIYRQWRRSTHAMIKRILLEAA